MENILENNGKTLWKVLRGGGSQWNSTRFVPKPPSLIGKENLPKQELQQLATQAFVILEIRCL